jgi:hypothetical protein
VSRYLTLSERSSTNFLHLTVQPRRRYVVTTDSDHDGPIFPNLTKEVTPTGPNQL